MKLSNESKSEIDRNLEKKCILTDVFYHLLKMSVCKRDHGKRDHGKFDSSWLLAFSVERLMRTDFAKLYTITFIWEVHFKRIYKLIVTDVARFMWARSYVTSNIPVVVHRSTSSTYCAHPSERTLGATIVQTILGIQTFKYQNNWGNAEETAVAYSWNGRLPSSHKIKETSSW